jgi:hypothetical protein
VEPEDLIDRRELEAMLFAIADIRDDVSFIRRALEEDDGREEDGPAEDS